jgi:chromate transporter
MNNLPDGARRGPTSLRDLFFSFSWIALQGFGGVMAIVQRELVEKRQWLTAAEFLEDWAVAQVLPGPNVCNLAVLMGDRCFGVRGALAAAAGLMLFPSVVVLALAAFLFNMLDFPLVQGMLRGMGAVSAGLIAGTALKLTRGLRGHPFGVAGCVALSGLTLAGAAVLHVPLVWLLLGLGVSGTLLAWLILWLQARAAGQAV